MTPLPSLVERLTALQRRTRHSPRNREVRAVVRLRARDACEYCLLPTAAKFQIEHIIPPDLWDDYVHGLLPGVPSRPGRGGPNHIDNYAWACPFCNQRKQDRVSHRVGRRLTRFFDPRHDHWPDHFAFAIGSAYLFTEGISPEGRATEIGLGYNESGPEGPLVWRHVTIVDGGYPPAWARIIYDV